MALPSQDPRVPRMPTWLFFAFLVWVAFITYVAQIRHLWWGWLGCLVTVQVALFMRKKWRNPGVVDRWGKPMHEKVAKYSPKIWAGMGYVAFAFGLLFVFSRQDRSLNGSSRTTSGTSGAVLPPASAGVGFVKGALIPIVCP
jgi:hypothetical protein